MMMRMMTESDLMMGKKKRFETKMKMMKCTRMMWKVVRLTL